MKSRQKRSGLVSASIGFSFRTILVTGALLLPVLAGCGEVPITGRTQFNLVPDSIVNSMSLQEYNSFLKENTPCTDPVKIDQVKRVGYRLVEAVERYCRENGMTDAIQGFSWEFNVIEDDSTVNAWCMPGGKVVVYTGILPVARDDAGLAVVLAHEIAHAVARHGSERMSQGLLYELGGMALSEALKNRPEATQQLFMQSYGVGAQVGLLLPYSRLHEKEADRLGLIFMAMAGYDPRVAVDFWKRMSSAQEGQSPPELLSTHPADATRIQYIEQMLPEAMTYYRPRQSP
jgi:predicted Zn-dependent protease